jgi:methyltransferase (TIGR00027 family)
VAELSPVSNTAIGVAAARARESTRPDRLFVDPYARRFLHARPDLLARYTMPLEPRQAEFRKIMSFHLTVRTRFFDDYLQTSPSRQIAIVAAGLDTRALRLPWPEGTAIYELDLPEVLEFKRIVLGADADAPQRKEVPADLRDDWPAALRAAGADPTRPTTWLVEGLMIYLDAVEATTLLQRITDQSAPGSCLAYESGAVDDRRRLERQAAAAGVAMSRGLWKGGLGHETWSWLQAHGWDLTWHDATEAARRYGRAVPEGAGGGYATGVKA